MKYPFYVCPGTSSWNSFAGRTQNMIENIRRAAMSGRDNGALGFLLTDWGVCPRSSVVRYCVE
jgi:hypothetical protein